MDRAWPSTCRGRDTVHKVNPWLTAQDRRCVRKQDKNDRSDAQAVARVVLRDGPEPPAVVIGDEAAVLELMNRERDRLMTQVDRLRNQLHNRLFQVDHEYRKSFPSLSKLATIQNLEQYTAVADSPGHRYVGRRGGVWPHCCRWY